MIQIGDKRHHLEIIQFLPQKKYRCKCVCGNIKNIGRNKFGVTKSCGCLKHRKNTENHTFTGVGQLYGKHWGSILRNAKIRNLNVYITKEQAWELFLKQSKQCALSGLDIDMGRDRWSASLDRIDSSKGYTVENVQWVHKSINRMKQDLDEKIFLYLCNLVINHNHENRN